MLQIVCSAHTTLQTINKALIHCSKRMSCSQKPIGYINTSIKALGYEPNITQPQRGWKCAMTRAIYRVKWEFKRLIIFSSSTLMANKTLKHTPPWKRAVWLKNWVQTVTAFEHLPQQIESKHLIHIPLLFDWMLFFTTNLFNSVVKKSLLIQQLENCFQLCLTKEYCLECFAYFLLCNDSLSDYNAALTWNR